jgi:hypothetical protein
MAIVPQSLRGTQRNGITYTALSDEEARSPIILSQRRSDDSAPALTFRAIGPPSPEEARQSAHRRKGCKSADPLL